jgi:exopolyphosphatase / guanosine-5'-triphosphate,3'-diphosphate pyrophosphatase
VDKIVPRWEWRTFGTDFGETDARFAVLKPERVQESDEIYLVSSLPDKVVKVRAGLVDIKSLERVSEAGLEQWLPVLKVPLPLSPTDFEGVCTALGVAPTASAKQRYMLEELLTELATRELILRAVPIHKKRLRFTIDGCMVELTDVRIEGAESRTVGIESEDPDLVVATVRDLGLVGRENTSYPLWLSVTVGPES